MVLVLVAMAFSSYWNWVQTKEMMVRELHSRQLLVSTNALISKLKDAETGQRGYLLTGSEDYLSPYNEAIAEIPGLLDKVTEAAGGDRILAEDASLLRRYSDEKLTELGLTVSLRREKGLDAALAVVLNNSGKIAMDQIRAVGEHMTNRETELLTERREATRKSAKQALWLTIAGLAGLFFVTLFLQRAIDRGIKAREQLAGDLDQAKQKLEVTLMSIGDAVIASDEMGRVTLMNSVAQELTGWTFEDAAGQPVDKVFHIVNEETRALVESPVSKVLRTGMTADLANHTVLIGKQGQEYPIDDSGAPIRDRRDQVLGVVLVFRDISKRRAQEIQIDKWHRIFQQSGFGVAILVDDGRTILEVNQAFAGMHGYQPEELRDKPFAELVDGESNYEEARQRTEDHAIYESLHRRKDGQSFHAVTDMTVFRNGAGEPIFRAAYFADISDRKRAEQGLRHSEARFRAAAEAMGDVIWTSNSKGEFTEEQPGWAAFSGQTFEEYRGSSARNAIHPEDMELFRAWERGFAGSRKFTAEIRMRRQDGQYRLMSTTAVPVFDDEDTVRLWVGALTDFTDQRRSEEEIRESDERFQGLATAFPQLVWSSKPDGNLEYANSLWREYTSSNRETTGERLFWDELLHPEDAGPHMERWKESMASGKMFESQVRLRRAADGTYRWFICRAVAVRGRDNRIVRWLGACTDINDQMSYAVDLRITNEALERSNADLEQFAYAASHDLQEPLRMISLYTQLLQEEYSGVLDETARSYVDFAVSGAQRMQRLLQDLMAYSRVSAGPAAGQSESSDAAVALAAALGNLEAMVRKSGAQFHIGELPLVAAPSVHMVLLFQNLVGNALKYCGDNVPEVWIDAAPVDKFWKFSVKDNGIGIEPQYAKQIFGIFKRLHGAEYEGTGIGLAVCQRIVERTGGKIWLESIPGEGSTFYFTLPRIG
ncbi:MAG: PAS domain S-box protein [Bryobacteraceae bacterium]